MKLYIAVLAPMPSASDKAAMADAVAAHALENGRTGPAVRVLGTPSAYIPQGKPDDILRELGLDATGIATEARRLLGLLSHPD